MSNSLTSEPAPALGAPADVPVKADVLTLTVNDPIVWFVSET